MTAFKPIRLRRELMLLLGIKLILIITIKLVFFSDPLRPDDDRVARALLSPSLSSTPVKGDIRP